METAVQLAQEDGEEAVSSQAGHIPCALVIDHHILVLLCLHLHLGGGLDELCDGDLVLLEPPLDQLRAADVDRAEDVPGVVLHEGAAIDDQGALRSIPQEAGQLLRIHHFAWESVSGHNGPVRSRASGAEGQGGLPAPVSPQGRAVRQGVSGAAPCWAPHTASAQAAYSWC